MKIIYEAFDGTQFNTESACLDYERNTFSYPNGTNVISVLKHIKSYCECRERCQKCPFNTHDNGGIENAQCVFDVECPAEWDIKSIKENFNAGGK